MAQPSSSTGLRSITVVIVLYRKGPSESETLARLREILKVNPAFAGRLLLIIYDNSPYAQNHEFSAGLEVLYHHDPANGGLAAAYNFALLQAERAKTEWLLVLDQDTSLTEAFLSELLLRVDALRAQKEIAAIVPKLLVQGKVDSPQMHFIDRIRHPFLHSDPIADGASGPRRERLVAYNSGATLRVSSLRAIGGFSEEFWLDFLDHAIFHALHASGCSVYVMDTALQHGGSHGDLNSIPVWRYRNMLAAQTLFVKRVGSFTDRMFYRLYLLRCSRTLWKVCIDRRMWRAAALRALWLGRPKHSAAAGRRNID